MANIVEIVVRAVDDSKAGFASAKASGEGLSAALTKVGAVSGVALAGVAAASIDMASKFQSATTRLVTSAGETNANIDLVRQGMLNMASQVGDSATELATGMYTIESAGYHGADGLNVLKAAAEGAKDENADLSTVANAVTDVLTDYHEKASDAANITSQMVKAVSFGKTTFEDFSGAMHNILPIASSVHLSFADVSGVLAEMTAHGVSADQASQNMANAIRSLIAPSKSMENEFKLLGINSDEVSKHLSTQGLGGTLQWLSTVAQDGAGKVGQNYTEALKKLMGTSAGLSVALMTTGENASATNAAIKGISGASADAQGNVEGFAAVQKTFAQQMSQLKAGAESLAIELGDKLLPSVTAVIGFMEAHQAVMKDVAEGVGILMGALAAYAIVAKTVAIAQAALDLVMEINPFVAIATAVVVIAALIIKYHKQIYDAIIGTWNTIKSWLTTAWGAIETVAKQVWSDIYNNTIGLVVKLFDDIKSTIVNGFDGWWSQHGEQIKAIWKVVWDFISGYFKITWDVISTMATVYWDALSTVAKVVWDAISTYFKVTWDIISGIFSVALSGIENTFEVVWAAIEAVVKVIWAAISAYFKIVWDTIVGIFDVALDLVTGHWGQAWKDVQTTVTQIWNAIKGFLSTVWNALVSLAGTISKAVTSVFSTLWNSVKSTTEGVWNDIKGFFSNASTWLVQGGKDIINGLLNGIKTAVSDIANWVNGAIVQPIIKAVKKFFGINSPSTVMAEMGGHLVSGLVKGVVSNAKGLGHIISSVFGGMPDALLHLIEKGLVSAAGLPGKALNALKGLGGDALNFLKGLGGDASGLWDQLFGGGSSTGGSGNVMQYKGMVDNVLGLLHQPLDRDATVLAQMGTESGGDPYNVNTWDSNWKKGTPSVGLMQVIGPTFREYAGQFVKTGPFEYGVSVDPMANIYAGMNYAISTYGKDGWLNVLGHGHGYAAGGATSAGWASVGEHGRELVKLPGGATVFPAGASAQMVAGGSASPVIVQLEIAPGGQNEFDHFMGTWVKNYVRVKGGGSVQQAFGRH